jgi:predicted component of type VI protein secretion system
MLQLVPVDDPGAPARAATEFPFTIGRSSAASLRLRAPGVWDMHASISIRDGTFHVQPVGESLLRINDLPSAGGPLRIGDELSIGATRFSVALAPAAQHGLAARERIIWLLIGAVTLAQLLLLFSIR